MRKYDVKQCALEYIDDRLADLKKYRAEQRERCNKKAAEAVRLQAEAEELDKKWRTMKTKPGKDKKRKAEMVLATKQEMYRKRHEASDLRSEAREAALNVDRSGRREKVINGVREEVTRWMDGVTLYRKPTFQNLIPRSAR